MIVIFSESEFLKRKEMTELNRVAEWQVPYALSSVMDRRHLTVLVVRVYTTISMDRMPLPRVPGKYTLPKVTGRKYPPGVAIAA